MYGNPIKVSIIINRDVYAGSLGPKARIVMEDGTVFWLQQGSNGPDLLVIDRLTREQIEEEFR